MRAKIVAAARWGIEHEPQIHYAEARPFPLTRALPLTTDCSGFVTLCYFLAGAPDPNGLDYSGTVLMRKYACCYAQGRPGAREFRTRASRVSTPAEFHEVVERYFPRVD